MGAGKWEGGMGLIYNIMAAGKDGGVWRAFWGYLDGRIFLFGVMIPNEWLEYGAIWRLYFVVKV
jgi:hypothetical protein